MEGTKKVLLTGVTGFLGLHTTIALLDRGYTVRGTLRNMTRSERIRNLVTAHSKRPNALGLMVMDLSDPYEKWEEAMADIDFVVHIASPFPTTLPKNENELILPAKNGTLNILKAANAKGVQRMVMTSSSRAAVYGNQKNGTFTEKDWTNIFNKKDTTPYFRSKTIAERAAWDYVNKPGNSMDLVTILPGAILAPILDKDGYGTSANLVKKLLDRSMPALPRIGFEMVDVRSVADAHIKALEYPKAKGNRYLCTNGYLQLKDISQILRTEFPARRIPTRRLPDLVVRLFRYFDKETQPVLNDLGAKRLIDNSKIKSELQRNPIPLKDAVIATANSLIEQGVI